VTTGSGVKNSARSFMYDPLVLSTLCLVLAKKAIIENFQKILTFYLTIYVFIYVFVKFLHAEKWQKCMQNPS
jgi:hypothetical protein